MKMIMLGCAKTSSSTRWKRNSNSPRYLEPATILAKSRLIRLRPSNTNGTKLLTILLANNSTIAVLPTPASPTKTGLFF